MVGVAAVFDLGVDVCVDVEGECAEKFLYESEGEVPDAGDVFWDAVLEIGTAAKVYGDAGERLVHWKEEKPVSHDPGFIAECFLECLAEHDADVFDGVVVIDFDVAITFHFEIEETVLGKKREHVIEEGDSGVDGALASAVYGEAERDVGLCGFAGDFRCAFFGHGGVYEVGTYSPALPESRRTARAWIMVVLPPLELA